MIFGDLVGLKLPDIYLTSEQKRRKNLTQKTCPDRGSNPGPLRDRRACYRLSHLITVKIVLMKCTFSQELFIEGAKIVTD